MKKIIFALMLVTLVGGSPMRSAATQTENNSIRLLPTPGKVVIDGKADDWDLSGGLLICDDVENQRDKLGVWMYAMHDRDNLYLLAHFLDETPLNNPGQTIADYGFAGDSLQVRFAFAPGTTNERVSHWTCWRGRDASDVMDVAYGQRFNEGGIKDAKTQGGQQAFLTDPDANPSTGSGQAAKGYVQELAIPWKLLTKDGQPPATGTQFVMTFEPNFTIGVNGRLTIKDNFKAGVTPDRVFTFQGPNHWGAALVESKGRVAPQPVRLADGRQFKTAFEQNQVVVDWAGLIKTKELTGFKPLSFTVPSDGYVSLNIYDPDGTVARQLLNTAFYTKGKHEVKWDGLTTPNWTQIGQPVAAGDYTWSALFHTGIGLRLRGWACNGGNAPWDNGPGSNWGGDHGVPVAASSDNQQVYLGWTGAEAGKAVLACDLQGAVKWANNRGGIAGVKALAVSDGVLYVLGGNSGPAAEGGALYKLDAKTGNYVPWGDGKDADVTIKSIRADLPEKADCLAAQGGQLFLGFTAANKIAVADGKTGKLVKVLELAAPVGLAAAGDAGLYVVSAGKSVALINPATGASKTIIDGLSNAVAVTAGKDGKLYVGLRDPENQVRIYTAAGQREKSLGRAGGRATLGPWQSDGFRLISALAVGADNKLWVVESDHAPKRVVAWDLGKGTVLKEFFGPSTYGALGGAINPLDPNLMAGQGCEWRLDPATGRATCLGVITRDGMENARFGVGPNGHVYLAVATRWSFDLGPVNIFERLGDGQYKPRTTFFYVDKENAEIPPPAHGQTGKAARTAIWADANDDGQRQPNEITYTDGLFRPSGWYMAMTPDLTFYAGDRQLKVTGWTACGAPQYDIAKAAKLPHGGHGTIDGRFLLTQGEYGVNCGWTVCSEIATGKRLWTYPDNFIGVHGSHNAIPPEVGMIRGSFGPCGSAKLPEPVGNVWVIPTNVGEWHILTERGFYLTRLFQGDPLKVQWPAEAIPGAPMDNTPPGMGGEDFGGSITQGKDGKLYLQAGKTGFWNLEITGLDSVSALPGGKITIGAKDVAQARAFQESQLQAAAGQRSLGLKRATPAFKGDFDNDFKDAQIIAFKKSDETAVRVRAAYDDQNLYVVWDVKDNTPWVNGATDPAQMYLGGDTVDLQLGTDAKADPSRGEAVAGDLRLSIGSCQGKDTAVLYRRVAKTKKPKIFSSGVIKSYPMDFVDVVADAKITVRKSGSGYVVEAAIPLAALELVPANGLKLRGDFGVTYGDPSGQRTRLRVYWNNQHTGIVDDAVFELQMEPKNWGELVFQP